MRLGKILKTNQGISQIQIEVLLALYGCPHPLGPPPLDLLTAFPPASPHGLRFLPTGRRGAGAQVLAPRPPIPGAGQRLLSQVPSQRPGGPVPPAPSPTCQEGGSQRHGDPRAIEQQQDAAGNPGRAPAGTLSQSPDAEEPEHRHLEGIPGDCRSRAAASAPLPPRAIKKGSQ